MAYREHTYSIWHTFRDIGPGEFLSHPLRYNISVPAREHGPLAHKSRQAVAGALPAEVAPQQKTPLIKDFFEKNIVRMVFGGKKNI